MASSMKWLGRPRWSTWVLTVLIAVVTILGLNINDALPVEASTSATATTPRSPAALTSVELPSLAVDEEAKPSSALDTVAAAEEAKSTSTLFKACHYLAYCRWWKVNAMPMPSVGLTSMSQLPAAISGSTAQFIFIIASLGILLMGTALNFVMSVDLLGQAIYTADYLYAFITSSVLGMDGTGSVMLAILIVGMLVSVGAKILLPGIDRTGMALGYRSIAISLIGVVALGFMATQASKNHSGIGSGGGKAPIASMAQNEATKEATRQVGDLEIIPLEDMSYDSSDWAFGSPGWFVVTASNIANDVGSVLSGAIAKVGNGISDGGSGGFDGSCGEYVKAMHNVFLQTDAAKNRGTNAATLVAYDNLALQLYYSNYKEAAFGSTPMAGDTWCRSVENQARIPTSEQALLARLSGQMQYLVGTGPVSGLQPVGSAPTTAGKLVAADGRWTEGEHAPPSQIFGPVFKGGDSSGDSWNNAGVQQIMFFAACDLSGAEPTIVPEFKGAHHADDGGDGDDDGDPLVPDDCKQAIETSAGFGSQSKPPHRFGYNESDGWAVVGPLFGIGAGSGAAKLSSDSAIEYYQAVVLGSNSYAALILAIISVAMTWLTIRYFGPVVVGALFSQALAVAALIFLTLFIILLIVPSKRSRKVFETVIKVICASLLVSSLVAILFSATMLLVVLFTAFLTVPGTDGILDAILTGAGALLAFYVAKQGVGLITRGNIALGMTGSGLKVAFSAMSPALQNLGFDAISPLDRDFWSFRKQHHNPERTDLTDDQNAPVQRAQANDAEDLLTDDSKSNKAALGKSADALAAAALKAPNPYVKGAGAAWLGATKVKDGVEWLMDRKDADADLTTSATSTGFGKFASSLHPLENTPVDQRKAQLLDNLVAAEPDLSEPALRKTNRLVPSEENARKGLAEPGSGFRAGPQTSPLSPAAAQSMMDRLNQQAMGLEPTDPTHLTGLDRAATSAWFASGSTDPLRPDLPVPADIHAMPLPPLSEMTPELLDQYSLTDLGLPESMPIPDTGQMSELFGTINEQEFRSAKVAIAEQMMRRMSDGEHATIGEPELSTEVNDATEQIVDGHLTGRLDAWDLASYPEEDRQRLNGLAEQMNTALGLSVTPEMFPGGKSRTRSTDGTDHPDLPASNRPRLTLETFQRIITNSRRLKGRQ